MTIQVPQKSWHLNFPGVVRATLTESLSETIKMNNDKLIRKVNQYFKDNPNE
jgi:hypothetical protein